MAQRIVEDRITIHLGSGKELLNTTIPESFLVHELDIERIERIWKEFLTSVLKRCKDRLSFLRMRNTKLQNFVFRTGLDNLCKEFSRRTEAFKLNFEFRRQGKTKDLLLTLTKLTAIPESCRNARFCVAEIPPAEERAYAEFVSSVAVDVGARYDPEVHVLVVSESTSIAVPSAQAIVLEESSFSTTSSERSSERSMPHYDNDTLMNPPVAMAMAVSQIASVTVEGEHRSVYERMQELESIKSFLSEPEYANKRQAILNSI